MGHRIFSVVLVAASLIITARASAVTFDKNVPQATQQQMVADLGFMNTIQGAKVSALHKQVFGDMQGAVYVNYFDSRVKRIGYDEGDVGGAVAYVAPFIDSSKMVLTSNFTKFSHPQIARLMVVYHEARHTEDDNGNWPHATCPTPFLDENGQEIKSIWTGLPLAGQDGCDDATIGAYGSSLILLKNISLTCSNCNEKVKMDAGIYADDQFKRITDKGSHETIRKDLYVH